MRLKFLILIFNLIYFHPIQYNFLNAHVQINTKSMQAHGAENNSFSLPQSAADDFSFQSQILPQGPWGPWLIQGRIYLPKGFNPTKKYGVVYFLHGRGENRYMLDTLGILGALDQHIVLGNNPFILVSIEGGTSYWMNAALKNERWSDVVTYELINIVENRYPVIKNTQGRILAGISMGGHGAIQNALNHPGTYGAIAAHSPVFRTQEEASKDFYEQFGVGSDFQERDPFSLIQYKGKSIQVPLWIDTGGSDFALNNTRMFAQWMQQINPLSELHIGEDSVGGHNKNYWSYHLPTYLYWYGLHLPFPQ